MRTLLLLVATLLLGAPLARSQEAAATPTAASVTVQATPVATATPASAPLISPRVASPMVEKATPAPLYRPVSEGMGQLIFYLLLLVGLFALGIWIMRNGLPTFRLGQRTEQKLHIQETRSLGGRQFLVVAEYEGQKMLLGVCPGRIDHLRDLPSTPTFPPLAPEPPPETQA